MDRSESPTVPPTPNPEPPLASRTEPSTPNAGEAETLPPVAALANAVPIPTIIPTALANQSRYRVESLLGQGGMGSVYLAQHTKMERRVALKVISPELIANADAVRRFRQEVTAAAQLSSHPNVVAVYDADEVDGLHFLAMEFVEGQSLADYLQARGPLPVAEACNYARQAALGLQHAATHGLVHRDIKPHNLMRTPAGQIKVLDFGLARGGRDIDKARSQLTQHGVMMGTADYMAPEQASDSRVADARADIYSLGCTLYHLLTGRVPFPGGGTVEKIIKHAVEAPTPLQSLRPDLPPPLVGIIEKMIAKTVDQRYQTPGEVAEALLPWTVAGAGASQAPIATLVAPAAFPTRPASRSPTVPRLPNAVQRSLSWAANWLMLGFYFDAVVGFFTALLFAFSGLEHRANLYCVYYGLILLVRAGFVQYGAAQMKGLRSYYWAVAATWLSLLPLSPCMLVTVPFGFRAYLALQKPGAREAFTGR